MLYVASIEFIKTHMPQSATLVCNTIVQQQKVKQTFGEEEPSLSCWMEWVTVTVSQLDIFSWMNSSWKNGQRYRQHSATRVSSPGNSISSKNMFYLFIGSPNSTDCNNRLYLINSHVSDTIIKNNIYFYLNKACWTLLKLPLLGFHM